MSIHPTAIIDPKADLADDVTVGPWCIVEANVRVGPGCRLYQNVYLTGWTEIGAACELHPGVIVGHAPQDTKYRDERSYCRIGSQTILREYVTVHRGTIPESETVIGESCFLLAGSHVGHNCSVGDHVTLINHALLAGHVTLGDHVLVSGGAAIHQFVRVGELAIIAGNARTAMDIPPFAMTDVEGRVSGLNRIGLRRSDLPREQVKEIRNVYRILYASGLRFSEAVKKAAQEVETPAGQRLMEFLQATSKRGIAGRSRIRANRARENREFANDME